MIHIMLLSRDREMAGNAILEYDTMVSPTCRPSDTHLAARALVGPGTTGYDLLVAIKPVIGLLHIRRRKEDCPGITGLLVGACGTRVDDHRVGASIQFLFHFL